MLEADTSNKLSGVVSRILGDFAFMVVGEELEEAPAGQEWLSAYVTYRGPMDGRINCWCTRPFANELSANLLGTDPSSPDAVAEAQDAVCEFMNILCGNLVTERFGTEPAFDLSIPTVEEAQAPPQLHDAPAHDMCLLDVSGTPLVIEHLSTNPA